MNSDLPAPLLAAEVDLTDFPFMPLDVRRLRDSRISNALSGEGFRCAVLLWCAAWHQKPAGSLPDDDLELSQFAGFGRAVSEWRKVRVEALYGWVTCSDERLYHPVVVEKALDAWRDKQVYRWRKECDRIRKINLGRKENGQDPLELPQNPTEMPRPMLDKAESSSGIPAENALKGKGKGEGEVREKRKDAPPLRDDALPFEDLRPDPAAVISNPEADLFRRGKDLLGSSAGGLVRKLVTANGGDISLSRAAIETAATKGNPREYIAAVINRSGPASRDIGGVRSSRDM